MAKGENHKLPGWIGSKVIPTVVAAIILAVLGAAFNWATSGGLIIAMQGVSKTDFEGLDQRVDDQLERIRRNIEDNYVPKSDLGEYVRKSDLEDENKITWQQSTFLVTFCSDDNYCQDNMQKVNLKAGEAKFSHKPPDLPPGDRIFDAYYEVLSVESDSYNLEEVKNKTTLNSKTGNQIDIQVNLGTSVDIGFVIQITYLYLPPGS